MFWNQKLKNETGKNSIPLKLFKKELKNNKEFQDLLGKSICVVFLNYFINKLINK